MNKVTKIFALILAAGGLVSLAGCGKKTTVYSTATIANWNVRTSANVEKDSMEYWKTHKEVCRYAVTHDKGGNGSYTVSYNTDGAEYYTEFYAENYDWQSADIPEDYRIKSEETVYVYKTYLKMSGEFTLLKKEGSKAFTDEVVSVCKFRLAGENLKPVYSRQQILNTAARNLSASTIDEACLTVDCVYTTYYNHDFDEATTVAVDNTKTESEKTTTTAYTIANKQKYSVFDNSQIRVAMRAMPLSVAGTRTFNVTVPQSASVQQCVAVSYDTTLLKPEADDMQKSIKKALDEAPDDYIFFDPTPPANEDNTAEVTPRVYRYNSVTLSIKEDLTGPSATQWYATVENGDANYSRGTLLKISTPLSFSMGILTYYLTGLDVESI